jgi:hypothetical protein
VRWRSSTRTRRAPDPRSGRHRSVVVECVDRASAAMDGQRDGPSLDDGDVWSVESSPRTTTDGQTTSGQLSVAGSYPGSMASTRYVNAWESMPTKDMLRDADRGPGATCVTCLRSRTPRRAGPRSRTRPARRRPCLSARGASPSWGAGSARRGGCRSPHASTGARTSPSRPEAGGGELLVGGVL